MGLLRLTFTSSSSKILSELNSMKTNILVTINQGLAILCFFGQTHDLSQAACVR